MNSSNNRPKVYFNVSSNSKELGKIVFELYSDITPKTAENFKVLCNGGKDDVKGYENTVFHRIIPEFMIQGGDTTAGNGTGGKSIYGNKFNDENFTVKHSKAGLLSMANAGKNTNGSQFFITTVPCPWLDGNHTVFGEVVEGMDVVKTLEMYGSSSGKPKEKVFIKSCGQL